MSMYTKYIQALKDGDLEVVKYLVEDCEANVHALNDYALFWAVSYGHLEVVKYLVAEVDDVHANDDEALRWAAVEGHLEVVKYLVEECDANVHAWEDASLRSAAYHGHLEIVKFLKEHNILQFTKRHIDKQIQIEKLNQILKAIRALPGIGIDYQNAFEQFNHLKLIY